MKMNNETTRLDKNKSAIYFEQYKLMVESSEKITSKRQDSNNYYLTVNSVLFGIASYLSVLHSTLPPALISCIGIVISLNWMRIIASYRILNKAKFKVIHEMEQNLPVALFTREHNHLQKEGYSLLTHSEKWVPWAFIVLHSTVIVISVATTMNLWGPWIISTLSAL